MDVVDRIHNVPVPERFLPIVFKALAKAVENLSITYRSVLEGLAGAPAEVISGLFLQTSPMPGQKPSRSMPGIQSTRKATPPPSGKRRGRCAARSTRWNKLRTNSGRP